MGSFLLSVNRRSFAFFLGAEEMLGRIERLIFGKSITEIQFERVSIDIEFAC